MEKGIRVLAEEQQVNLCSLYVTMNRVFDVRLGSGGTGGLWSRV